MNTDLIPTINPNVNSKTDDHSSVDQSQHIHVSGNYNASNSNNSGMTKKQNQAHPWITILLCCSMMASMWFALQHSLDQNRFEEKSEIQSIAHKLEMTSKESEHIHEALSECIKQTNTQILNTKTQIEIAKNQAKEGTIWLLRDDIIKSIDYFESAKVISQKQFKRLKDEYEYYTSIGGNHDVKDCFDNFQTKIFGTREIQMVETVVLQKTYSDHPER